MAKFKTLIKKLDRLQIAYKYKADDEIEGEILVLDRARVKAVYKSVIVNKYMATIEYMMMDVVSPMDTLSHWEVVVLMIGSMEYTMSQATVGVLNSILARYWTVCTRVVAIRRAVKPMEWSWMAGRDSYKFSIAVQSRLMSMRSTKVMSGSRPRLDRGIDRVELGNAGQTGIKSGIEAKIMSVIKHVNKASIVEADEIKAMNAIRAWSTDKTTDTDTSEYDTESNATSLPMSDPRS